MKRLVSLVLICSALQTLQVAAQHKPATGPDGSNLAQGVEPPHRLVVRKKGSMPSEGNPAQKQP